MVDVISGIGEPNRRKILLLALFMLGLMASHTVGAAPRRRTVKAPLLTFHVDLNSVSRQEGYLRKWLKKAAEMGYNPILWEVEDEIKWETCPECASPDAFSKETFQEILQYSRKLGLEPIPLLQTLGHAEYVLRNKNMFHCERIRRGMIATVRPTPMCTGF